MEAKMDASHERLEAKIDAANTRLEAMFKELLTARALQSAAPMVVEAQLHLTVTNSTPAVSNKKRPASPNHGASRVSNHSGDEVGGGDGTEEARERGQGQDVEQHGEAKVDNAKKEDELSLNIDNAAAAAGTDDIVQEVHPQQVHTS